MATFFPGYIEPGAYFQFQPSAQFVTPPGGVRVCAFVGTTTTSKTILSEEVTKGALNGTDNLANVATDILNIEDENGVIYTEGVDFNLTGGDVDWSPTGTGTAEPAVGVKYFVDYVTTKVTADYVPLFYFSMEQVKVDHGEPSTTNQVSLAAYLAFQNGATVVLLSPVDPADSPTNTGYTNALDRIKQKDCQVVVMLRDDSSLRTALKTHVNQMSTITERKHRVGFIGLSGSQTVSGVSTIATGLNSKRIALVWPPSVKMDIPNIGEESIDGFYLASALAGLAVSAQFDVAEPLTRKEVAGFTEITDNLLKSEKRQLGAAGVLVVEVINGIARVMHQLMTAQTGKPEDEELSMVASIDFVGLSWAQILETIYIGSKLTPSVISQIRTTSGAYLQSLQQSAIINGFQNVTAVQNTVDPRQVDVTAEIRFIFPTTWIFLKYSLTL